MFCRECGSPIDGSYGTVCLQCAATEDAIGAAVEATVEFVALRSVTYQGIRLA